MADDSVALGRPWHPGGDPNAVASVAFINCFMEGHISDRGWEAMSSRDKEGQTVWFSPQDSRFVEFGSAGPGARRSESRPVLSESEAPRYTIANVLDGWDPGKEAI